jgi:hypothetical protein
MSNCSSTERDLVILSVLRAGTAFLCAAINALILVCVATRLDKSLLVNRVIIYLTTTSLLALLANTSQAVSAFCHAPWHSPTCVFVGLINQLTAWLLLMVSLWLMSHLSLRYWSPDNREILTAKMDVAVWIGMILIAILMSVIPLGTKGYGLNLAWCWIGESRRIEQWLLWQGWVVTLPGVTLLAMIAALWRSEKQMRHYYESSRGVNCSNHQRNRAVAKRMKVLISCIVAYWILITTAVVTYQIPKIKRTTAFLIAMAILEPLSIVAVPAMLAVHLQLQELRQPPAQRAQGANFQHCDGESIASTNNREKWKKVKGLKNQDLEFTAEKHRELQESLLLTLTDTS